MIWFEEGEDGGWNVWILEKEIPGLLSLPGRMRDLLENTDFTDRVTASLFPRAYRHNDEAELEYQRLLREDLVKRKLEAVELVEKTLARAKRRTGVGGPCVLEISLSGEDLAVWLGFLHDVRLTIGSALGITDESWERDLHPDDPDFDERLLLNQLSYLEEAILQAIRESESGEEE